MRILNILAISLFIESLIFFSLVFTTNYTHQVLVYFIPDMSLVLGNLLMTFILKQASVSAFLNSGLIKFLIALGYYINIFSAIFYALMYLDETWVHSGAFDPFQNLWVEFADIMKFKVTATLHALTFKWYADMLRS